MKVCIVEAGKTSLEIANLFAVVTESFNMSGTIDVVSISSSLIVAKACFRIAKVAISSTMQ